MGLTRKEVEWIAHLARLELTEEMAGKMAGQLSQVLDYIAKLDAADTAGVEPMSHSGSLSNVFREDVPAPSLDREAALRNAPEQAGGYFRVPRVIE